MDAPACFGSPRCRCGSRNSRRIGQSALLRQCQDCGETYAFRLRDGYLIPLAVKTAEAWDLEVARG